MISTFHYITQDIPGFTHAQLAECACMGGADWIQLRVKKRPIPDPSRREGGKFFDDILLIARETKNVCKKYNAKLIVNDYVIIAKEVSADGVHLGKEDMNPKKARKILDNNFIIGGTANSFEEVKQQIENKVDYIGLGPYRFTNTKTRLNPLLGLEGIKRIVQEVLPLGKDLGWACPLIGIGGITVEDVEPLMNCGVHGIAVSSAVTFSEDKIEMTRRFLKKIKERRDAPWDVSTYPYPVSLQ